MLKTEAGMTSEIPKPMIASSERAREECTAGYARLLCSPVLGAVSDAAGVR